MAPRSAAFETERRGEKEPTSASSVRGEWQPADVVSPQQMSDATSY